MRKSSNSILPCSSGRVVGIGVPRRAPRGLALLAAVVGLSSLSMGCTRDEDQAQTTFYDRRIGPILQASCTTSPTQSSCHVAADDRGNALGNLDLNSYQSLNNRRDLLINYGPYGVPALLLKAMANRDIALTTWDNQSELVTTDIPHAGGNIIDITSGAFSTINRWIENGASENNAPPAPKDLGRADCSSELGVDAAFDPNTDPPNADYPVFATNVNGVLTSSCAAGNCHGARANALYLTCGDTPEQVRWNYFAAGDYVSTDPPESEILRRALAPEAGGTYHEGGTVFTTRNDSGYVALTGWATQKAGPNNIPADPGFEFFSRRVQPMLAKRGCMMLNCHSSTIFHDYRLHGGSGGHFSLPATRKNYELSLEQVALESDDPNASRLIRKNLVPDDNGILHRGGSLFGQDGDPAACDLAAAESGPLNDQRPYCVIVRWLEVERQARRAGAMPFSGIVYVRRPAATGPETPQDWASFAGGAELVRADGSMSATGAITLGAETVLNGGCGLGANVDIRRPAVSWDGTRIAFAARGSASEPYRIYVVDGGNCAVEPSIDAAPVDDKGAPVSSNGELVHNFDPTFSPDGRIVFASTRGNVMNTAAFPYQGTQRTPADPSKLNANLYVAENGKIRQLTFLLNQEIAPNFMNDGRVILTAEKRAPGFYQLAGRRINLDGGDYHPLFGQRNTIGFDQFTDVVELTDKNLAAIVSQKGAAHSAGALIVANRSIGVDHTSQTPEDYLQDPGAIGWPNPAFFQHSIKFLDPAATGRLDGTQGAYRNPSALPNGQILVSYAPNVADLSNFNGNFDVYMVDPIRQTKTALVQNANDLLWPVAIYARHNPIGVFTSRPDEPNGVTRVFPGQDRAEITYLDLPLLTSLLFQNTRTGRIVNDGGFARFWQDLPPETGITSYMGANVVNDQYGQLYVRRQLLGTPNLNSDGSAKVSVPGGMPILLEVAAQLAGDSGVVSHFQREEVQFYPGEVIRQSFRRELFNGMCAGCHGSISGYEVQISPNPDILTTASSVQARKQNAVVLDPQGGSVGPPFN